MGIQWSMVDKADTEQEIAENWCRIDGIAPPQPFLVEDTAGWVDRMQRAAHWLFDGVEGVDDPMAFIQAEPTVAYPIPGCSDEWLTSQEYPFHLITSMRILKDAEAAGCDLGLSAPPDSDEVWNERTFIALLFALWRCGYFTQSFNNMGIEEKEPESLYVLQTLPDDKERLQIFAKEFRQMRHDVTQDFIDQLAATNLLRAASLSQLKGDERNLKLGLALLRSHGVDVSDWDEFMESPWPWDAIARTDFALHDALGIYTEFDYPHMIPKSLYDETLKYRYSYFYHEEFNQKMPDAGNIGEVEKLVEWNLRVLPDGLNVDTMGTPILTDGSWERCLNERLEKTGGTTLSQAELAAAEEQRHLNARTWARIQAEQAE